MTTATQYFGNKDTISNSNDINDKNEHLRSAAAKGALLATGIMSGQKHQSDQKGLNYSD